MNGSELALRVALSDVIEKWRRSQEKCKYYEQCRNELVKELQRVKQVNEDLMKENTALQASLETSASLPHRTDNGMAETMRQAKSHSPLVPVSSSDRIRQNEEDENQIYQRLLSEMRLNVIQAARNPKPAVASAASASSDRTHIGDDSGANNSVGSELVVGMQPRASSAGGGGAGTQKADHQHQAWIRDADDSVSSKSAAAGSAVCDHPAGKQVADRDAGVRIRVPAAGQPESQDVQPADFDDEKSLSHVYAKIIAAMSADLLRASQTILNQKEKLAKLKSKQLRSYFRRLKGEDHQSGNIPANSSASRCHFEQV
jgi:regulator of replication initiation timing